VVELERVVVAYGDAASSATVLDNVSLAVPDGGLTVLLGPAGPRAAASRACST